MINNDPFFKKVVPFEFKEHKLNFNVSQDLFSSQDIDKGTKRLLRTFLQIDNKKYRKVLDLGCGYGPIGISLKKESPESEVHMVDRNALALLYTRQNAEKNEVDVNVYASLGYDDIKDRDFGLIISNIPAKVGTHVLNHILIDSQYHLSPNGCVAIVVVDAILEETKSILTTNPNITISLQKSWLGHTVFHYHFSSVEKNDKGSFQKGIYDRTQYTFSFDKQSFTLQTTYNLPEFDTLSYDTKLLLDNLDFLAKCSLNTVVIFNPNQGHIAIAVAHTSRPNTIILVDRNLQALKVTQRNLIRNGYQLENILLCHQVSLQKRSGETGDAVVGILPEKENRKVYELYFDEAIDQLVPNGVLAFSSSSTVITQLERIAHQNKKVSIIKRERTKAKSMILIKKK